MRAASMREWVSGRPRWRSRWVRSPPSNTRSGWKPFETGCTRASFLAVACTSFTGDASLDDRRAAIDSGVPLRSSVYRGRTPSHDATGGGVIDFPQHPGHHPMGAEVTLCEEVPMVRRERRWEEIRRLWVTEQVPIAEVARRLDLDRTTPPPLPARPVSGGPPARLSRPLRNGEALRPAS